MRIDSAGYQLEVIDTCNALGTAFTITAPNKQNVRAAIEALATNATDDWQPALGTEGTSGSDVARPLVVGARKQSAAAARPLRLIVRRQRTRAGD